MSRPFALWFAVAAFCGLGLSGDVSAQTKPEFDHAVTEQIRVDAKRIVHFDKGSPAKRRFGKLEFRGGLELTSPASRFGGWSGLEIDADGRGILAVSDAGVWLTGAITYDGVVPSGISGARLGSISGTGGVPLARDRDRDAEAVVLSDGSLANGHVLIAFEQNHRIGRFPVTSEGLGAPTSYLALPAEARRQSPNKGLESVCVLRGGPQKGAVVALSERFPDRSGTRHAGWLLPAGRPATATGWATLQIHNIDGYDLTDCRGLVLERRFRWSNWYEGVKTRLRRFAASELKPGEVMQGEILLDADMGQEIDNLEGLAVHRDANGRTVLTMISDNNYNSFLQRTVILQFTLHDHAAPDPVQTTRR